MKEILLKNDMLEAAENCQNYNKYLDVTESAFEDGREMALPLGICSSLWILT